MKKVNQELEEQIMELKEDKQSQDERFEKIQNNNNLLENKLVQIQKEASRLSGKQIQVEEEETNTNSVPTTVQKKSIQQKNKQQELLIDSRITKCILTNDKVKMNINRGDMISEEKEQKLKKLSKIEKFHPTKRSTNNSHKDRPRMDDFTNDATIFWGICNSYRFVSSNSVVTNTKIKKMSLQTRHQIKRCLL